MNEFNKSRWSTEGDEIRIDMDFHKVDKKRRVVTGWATIDNVDTEGDVVTAEASLDAFSRSRGNLREMHKKDSAVGRVISYKPDTFKAPDGTKYQGIFVKVRVSEGAQDTWLKVLDGTLNGFSIGGSIIDSEEEFQKDSGLKIRKVTKYDLTELSLVDNPGNQYSDFKNIFKVRNSSDGSVTAVSGMIEEHKVLNVFYCNEDEIVQEKPDDSYECPICSEEMNLIGLVEETAELDEKVNALVSKYRGGETMTNNESENTDETVETGHEAGDPTEVPTPAEPAQPVEEEDIEEESAEVDEVSDESEEISKKIDSLKTDIKDILSKNNDATNEKIETLEKNINELNDMVQRKTQDLEKKLENIDTDLKTQKSRITSFEKQLNKSNSGVAFRKSADLDNSAEEEQESTSIWNGAFSVDNL